MTMLLLYVINDLFHAPYRNINHPNLSSCLGIHQVDQGMAILSPLVRGFNLHDHIFSNVPSKASIYSTRVLNSY